MLGKMKAREAAEDIEEIGEKEEAKQIRNAIKNSNPNAELATVLADKLEPWQCTSHAFGFISISGQVAGEIIEIVDARSITPDPSLKGASIVIAADAIR